MDCARCAAAEYREAHPWRAQFRDLVAAFTPQPRGAAAMVSAFGSSMAAALGAAAGTRTTHAESHRAEFIRTGDPLELNRMLRAIDDASLP